MLKPTVKYLLAVSLIPLVGIAGHAQDQQADPDPAQEQTQAADQAPAEGTVQDQTDKKPVTTWKKPKVTFFVGDRPQLVRQKGPALGTPTSILPKPFVSPSALNLPGAKPPEGQEGRLNSVTQTDGDLQSSAPPGQTAEIPGETTGEAGALGLPAGETVFAGEQLETPDPSGLGLLSDDQAFPAEFWSGYSREEIISGLYAMTAKNASPTLRRLLRRIALSTSSPPASTDGTEIAAYLKARLAVLASIGDMQGYIDLIEAIPADMDTSTLTDEITRANLLAGRLGAVCATAAVERQTNNAPYWLKVIAFCDAASGNRMAVDFQLGVLEEIASLSPAFYQLIERVLVQAEGPQTDTGDGYLLDAPLEVTSLNAAMARLSRLPVERVSLDRVDPLAVPLFLSLPNLGHDAAAELIMLGLRNHSISPETVATYIKTTDFEDIELAGLATEDATGPDQENLGDTVASVPPLDILSAAKTLAMPFDETGATTLTPVLDALAAYAVTTDTRMEWATIIAHLLADGNDRHVETGLRVRSALLRHEYDQASQQILTLRTATAGEDAAADNALIGLWPYVVLTDTYSATTTPAAYAKWAPTAHASQNPELPIVLLEAFGREVPDQLWRMVEANAATGQLAAVPTSLWRRMTLSARRGDRVGTFTAALRILTASGLAGLPADVSGAVLQYMGRMGMEAEASKLAVELLVAQGH